MVENDRVSVVRERPDQQRGAGHGSRQICLTCRRGEEAAARGGSISRARQRAAGLVVYTAEQLYREPGEQ